MIQMEFTLTDNGTITHNELTDIHNQMTLVQEDAYLYFLAVESVQTIKDFRNVWTSKEIEALFMAFLGSDYSSTKSDTEIFNLMFSGEFKVANIVSVLLHVEHEEFAAQLVSSMHDDVEAEVLFNKFGISDSPLAEALITTKHIPMTQRVAVAFVFEVLRGKDIAEALEAARS